MGPMYMKTPYTEFFLLRFDIRSHEWDTQRDSNSFVKGLLVSLASEEVVTMFCIEEFIDFCFQVKSVYGTLAFPGWGPYLKLIGLFSQLFHFSFILMCNVIKKQNRYYTRMLQAILNESCEQHPMKQQLYGHFPAILKTIQIRWIRHAVEAKANS